MGALYKWVFQQIVFSILIGGRGTVFHPRPSRWVVVGRPIRRGRSRPSPVRSAGGAGPPNRAACPRQPSLSSPPVAVLRGHKQVQERGPTNLRVHHSSCGQKQN